jgi:hypothetical protein
MIQWKKFYPLMTAHTGPCPTATLKASLAEAAADFCARTYVWQSRLDPEQTDAGEPLYTLSADGVVESVLWMSVDGREIAHVHSGDIPPSVASQTGSPVAFSLVNDFELRFYPTPDATYTFEAVVALKPALSARGVEDFLYENHGRAIANGALALLLAMPAREWTNLELAVVYQQLFERGIAKARVRDYRKIPLRVKPVYF